MSAADPFVALFLFSLISACTPGPNNVMLLASGVNFGFRRTVPHMAGVSIGFPVMMAAVALGLGSAFRAEPRIHDVIEVIGVVYLLWLAWKIAAAPVGVEIGPSAPDAADGRPRSSARPMSFLAAVAFQWVNVKAWIIAISAVSVYVPESYTAIGGAALLFGVTLITGVISTVQWAAFGSLVARFLREPMRLRIFNVTMAALLIVSLWPAAVDIAGWFGIRG
ncbi:LysE family translocator [Siculibacillus lacustris]|uniref:LysE family translocator n=1 Tax=Siculibacillus lacustris TaxID=1549641 RepID=A0A4Q9VRF7_9HYPH|nr:LysE family translocator [Siculibacillus lacustris]TBW38464.1 LysE family translocator [Siculibacillus lacustris]